ncbi:Kazal-type serine protease inhibitor family protein [Hymenobacter sediminis]|uniref:Kazal-type serine protease inhibitor family protein n=1 Tax=Hymenobacter sediminis TaxID=2218621 RepID=UPI00192E529E|nr:Kazal-type serine protease inhibitor [Hymenobacter sediminis]
MKQLALFALLLVTGACSKDQVTPAPVTATSQAAAVRPPYQCLDVYDPVCSNGVTYSNACYAHRAGVTTYTKGACGN